MWRIDQRRNIVTREKLAVRKHDMPMALLYAEIRIAEPVAQLVVMVDIAAYNA
jgi:hypothetical protein